MNRILQFIIIIGLIAILLMIVALPLWRENQEQADALDALQARFNALSVEHEKLQKRHGRMLDAALEKQKDELEAECKTALEQQQGKHRVELGQQRLKWLEKVWIMYYNTCMVLVGQQDTCLKSARNGYVEGAHDMRPAPGWDWYFMQFGKFLDKYLDSG